MDNIWIMKSKNLMEGAMAWKKFHPEKRGKRGEVGLMNGMAHWSCFHFAASNETCREDAQIKQNCFQQTQRLLVHWMEPTRILSLQDMKCQAFMALNSSSEARYSASSACKRKLLPESMEVLLVHPGFSQEAEDLRKSISQAPSLKIPQVSFRIPWFCATTGEGLDLHRPQSSIFWRVPFTTSWAAQLPFTTSYKGLTS